MSNVNLNKDNKSLQIFGTKELNELFEQLKDSQQRSLYISTFRKLLKPVIRDIRSKITNPNLKGLKKSIGIKPINRVKAVRFGASRKKNKQANLANIYEKGTDDRYTKSGAYRGRVEGLNFFYSTLESHEKNIKDDFYDAFLESFQKMVERYNKKQKRVLK
ncbi:MAG: hypothetical protein ACOCUI_00035 [bacterium]